MQAEQPQTDFEGVVETQSKEPTPQAAGGQTKKPAPARDVDGIPYCCTHHCRMKRVSGGKKGGQTVYYKCAASNCDNRAQIVKTRNENVVPPRPQICPRCSTDRKPVICERDERLSRADGVILSCPRCSWRTTMLALPHVEAQRLALRDRRLAHTPDLGDR